MPGPMGRRNRGPAQKVENSGQVLKRLFGIIFKKYKFQMIIVFVCILISVLANVQGSLFIQNLIDDYITPMIQSGSRDFGPMLGAILRVAIFYAIGAASAFIYAKIMVYVTQGTMRDLRCQIFEHMESLPIKYFDTHPHGDIMSVYTNDIDTLRQMISQSIPQLFNSGITIIAVLVSMFTLSVPLTILTLVMVGLMLFVTKQLASRSGRFFAKQQADLGATNGYIEEMMNGQKVVKVFCHEEAAERDFDAINEQLFSDANHAQRYANIFMPIMGNIGNILYVLTAFLGGVLICSGGNIPNLSFQNLFETGSMLAPLKIAVVASFLGMTKQFTGNVSQVSQQINAIVMAAAGASRVFELIDQQPEEDNGHVTLIRASEAADGTLTESAVRTGVWAWKCPQEDGSSKLVKLCGDVRFFDVDFAYDPEKPVLHDITLYAKPGQKLAFVGATGAGKTTITNLINRFYDLADGKIRYDGININHIKKADLRHSLGIVLQDVNLFTGTVMDNIRYGKLDATDEECIAAAKLANAHDFITRLPDGYNTMLTANGANLSQGQRQLLSIARAAVADPPVMILDEATSSIDTRTELLVQRGMDALMKGRTVFVIAHRLSTVQNSDAIMVLDHGRIIERGTHDDLIAQKGTYYQLYTGAFELE